MASRKLLAALLGSTLTAAAPALAANGTPVPTYTVTDLGAAGGSTGDGAKAINASGQIGVAFDTYAYLYTNGTLTPPGGVNDGNGPLAINDLGHLAGSGNLRGFIYRNGTSTDLGQLEATYGSYTFAQGINNADTVVGNGYRPTVNAYHAFVWTPTAGIRDLAPAAPAGVGSNAAAVDNAGLIVGQYNDVAARWDAAGNLTPLANPAGRVRSAAVAVNGNGDAVGSSYDSSYSSDLPTLWHAGTTASTVLPLLGPYPFADALADNDLGQVIGTAGYAGSVYAPTLWQNNAVVNLNTLIPANSGWTLGTPRAINDAGQIVGTGTLNGVVHAYLLTAVPEPATAAVAATLAGVGLLGRRSRRPRRPRDRK